MKKSDNKWYSITINGKEVSTEYTNSPAKALYSYVCLLDDIFVQKHIKKSKKYNSTNVYTFHFVNETQTDYFSDTYPIINYHGNTIYCYEKVE